MAGNNSLNCLGIYYTIRSVVEYFSDAVKDKCEISQIIFINQNSQEIEIFKRELHIVLKEKKIEFESNFLRNSSVADYENSKILGKDINFL